MTAMTPGTRIKVEDRPAKVVRVERKTYVEPRWNRPPAMVLVEYDDGQRQIVAARRVRVVE